MVPDSGSKAPGSDSDSDPGHSHSHKKSRYLNQKKKSETMKHGNTETRKHGNWIQDRISKTVFLRLHFCDRSPEITGIGTAFTGPHFRDHRNWDFILNITEAGSHFFNYGNRIKFLISRNRDCISNITGVGTAFPRSRDWVCTSEITEMAL